MNGGFEHRHPLAAPGNGTGKFPALPDRPNLVKGVVRRIVAAARISMVKIRNPSGLRQPNMIGEGSGGARLAKTRRAGWDACDGINALFPEYHWKKACRQKMDGVVRLPFTAITVGA